MSPSTAGYVSLSMDDKELKRRLRNRVKVVHIVDVVPDSDSDADADAEKVKRVLKKVNRTRKKDKKKSCNLYSISDEDLKVYPLNLEYVEDFLPAMAETFEKKDWSLLRRYCFSSDPSLVNKVALKHELVAICVFFLLTDVPPHVKEGVSWALKSISSKDPEDTDVSVDDQATNTPIDQVCIAQDPEDTDDVPVDQATNTPIDQVCIAQDPEDTDDVPVDHAPNTPIDQAFIDAVLVDVLFSDNVEVLRQVCWTLAVLVSQYSLFAVGICVQSRLLQLVRIFDSHKVITAALCAISRIAMVDKGMNEKLVEAVVSDSQWLLNFTRDSHEMLREKAYWTVASITEGHCSNKLWEELKKFIPGIVKEAYSTNTYSMMRAAAFGVFNATQGASPDRIEVLVDLGCLKMLHDCLLYTDECLVRHCLFGIENILIAGRGKKGNSREENKYAKMIDGYDLGWDLLLVDKEDYSYCCYDILSKSFDMVRKYGPRNWLNTDNRHRGWVDYSDSDSDLDLAMSAKLVLGSGLV